MTTASSGPFSPKHFGMGWRIMAITAVPVVPDRAEAAALSSPPEGERAMEKQRIRALRQAQLYGYLIHRTGRLYYPGGSHPVCSVQTAHEMVRAGWLVYRDGKYEITPVGLSVLELEPTR
jgi:hypothetical protein